MGEVVDLGKFKNKRYTPPKGGANQDIDKIKKLEYYCGQFDLLNSFVNTEGVWTDVQRGKLTALAMLTFGRIKELEPSTQDPTGNYDKWLAEQEEKK